MAFFRDFTPQQKSDRSAQDVARHNQKVRKAIKENLGDIVAEESIIGQDGRKKIKIPIKGIKEYTFIYGNGNDGVGTGRGNSKRGDVVSQSDEEGEGQQPGKAGNTAGEDVYETEITLEELIDLIAEDFALPDMERKKMKSIEIETLKKYKGTRRKGIPPRLDKKKSLIEKIKRSQKLKPNKDNLSEEDGEKKRIPFNEDDLRYKYLTKDIKRYSNAVIFCIMDVSGSMYMTKKYLARSFFFFLYHFIRSRYQHTDLVFISHHTEAKEVSENEFFHHGETGGTMISSGYKLALDIIEKRYNPSTWNIYAFHCSDGENFDSDNDDAVNLLKELISISNFIGYGEIKDTYNDWGSITTYYEPLEKEFNNFQIVRIQSKDDLWPGLKSLLSKDKNQGGE